MAHALRRDLSIHTVILSRTEIVQKRFTVFSGVELGPNDRGYKNLLNGLLRDSALNGAKTLLT